MFLPPLHILCFGDGLTAGFVHTNETNHTIHPYAGALQSSLEKAFPQTNVTVDVQGALLDRVIAPGRFLERIEALYSITHAYKPYTHAIILGGIHDIAAGSLPSEIINALQQVWAVPLSHHTPTIALTLSECPACVPNPRERRLELNQRILNHYGGADFHAADIDYEIEDPWRERIFSDGVHFTPLGYDNMGALIAERLIDIITPPPPLRVQDSAGNILTIVIMGIMFWGVVWWLTKGLVGWGRKIQGVMNSSGEETEELVKRWD